MPRNTCRRVEELGRERQEANKGLAIQPVTTVGDWSSAPLGNSGIQCITCQGVNKTRREETGILICHLLY